MIEPIGIVFGTRPEYLKCKPLFQAFEEANLHYRIIHVKQHVDLDIEEKNLPNYVCVNLSENRSLERLNALASELPRQLELAVKECKSILVQGDTATAFFGCLTAFHLQKPIFHLEAGLRTYDVANPFPEEAYRSMISRLATYHLCPDETAKENLSKENIKSNVYVVGNSILDLVKSYKYPVEDKKQVLITIHRRENWLHMKEIVESVCDVAIKNPSYTFVWILHPNPVLQNQVSEVLLTRNIANIRTSLPIQHKDLCSYITSSSYIITDSGGIQEEASFLGKICFVLRKVTERSSIPKEYIRMIQEHSQLLPTIEASCISQLQPCYVYGNGFTGSIIARIIKNLPKDNSS